MLRASARWALLVAMIAGAFASSSTTPSVAAPRHVETPKSDFNGDGFADLAIGSYDDDTIVVLYGSPSGLTSAGRQVITDDWIGGVSTGGGGRFGDALAAGDFNGDGFADLAIGDLWTDTNMGACYVLYGSRGGLTRVGSQVWDFASPGIKGKPDIGDDLGGRVVAGNFGRGPEDDLAVAADEAGVAGKVLVVYGSPDGLSAAGNQLSSPNSPGIDEHATIAESFGTQLAPGNFGRGPYDDLAIGSSKPVAGFQNSGAVTVLYGSPTGLSSIHSQVWTAASPGIGARPGVAFDFGSGLAAGNFGRGGFQDLAVSAAGETVGGKRYAGALYVLYGSRSGLTSIHAQRWTRSSPFIAGNSTKEGWFAAAIVSGDFGRGPHDDLAVGQPFATVGRHHRAGAVHVLFGTPTGLRARGSQLWTLNTAGVHGKARANRQFGSVGCAADFGRGRWDELVVTEADQPPDNSYGPGAVQVLYGSAHGPRHKGVQRWREGEHGIPGPRTAYDLFGSVACG